MCASAALLGHLAGCSPTSQLVIGKPRPAISAGEVRVYEQPPAHFEPIAEVSANSSGAFAFTDQRKTDVAIGRLKEAAAKLGANAILLESAEYRQTGSIGTGVGTGSYGAHGSVGVGVSTGGAIYAKSIQARAIYVPPEASAQPNGTAPSAAPPGSPASPDGR